MTTFTVKPNQAAIVIETSEEGEISVEVIYPEETPDEVGLSAAICEVLAHKILEDDEFQDEIMNTIDELFPEEGEPT